MSTDKIVKVKFPVSTAPEIMGLLINTKYFCSCYITRSNQKQF